MKFGIVGRTTEGFFRYQAWPTVAKDDKGVVYTAASGHRLGHVCPFGKDLLYISREAPDWDLGYPSSIELSDGSILTVYYQKYPGDRYNSILSTRWELP